MDGGESTTSSTGSVSNNPGEDAGAAATLLPSTVRSYFSYLFIFVKSTLKIA
jgi:hypothetical protein